MAEQPNAQLLRGELKPQLEENLKDVQKILNLPLNKDVVLRRYGCEGFEACAIYIEGMADDKKISEFILHACKESDTGEAIAPEQRAERLMESYIEIAQCVKAVSYTHLVCCVRDTLREAVGAAYIAAAQVRFEGMHMRTDIGARALAADGMEE